MEKRKHMDVFAGIVLLAVMYVVIPVAVTVGMIVILGGSERLLPGAMRDRAVARRNGASEHH